MAKNYSEKLLMLVKNRSTLVSNQKLRLLSNKNLLTHHQNSNRSSNPRPTRTCLRNNNPLSNNLSWLLLGNPNTSNNMLPWVWLCLTLKLGLLNNNRSCSNSSNGNNNYSNNTRTNSSSWPNNSATKTNNYPNPTLLSNINKHLNFKTLYSMVWHPKWHLDNLSFPCKEMPTINNPILINTNRWTRVMRARGSRRITEISVFVSW